MKLALLDELLESRRAGRPAALVTHLETGRQVLIDGDRVAGDLAIDDADLATIRRAIDQDRSAPIEGPAGTLFVEVWNPPLRLVVIGAVHIAQALAPLGALAGHQVALVDPRSAFAAAHRFAGIDVTGEWPDKALARLRPDKRTAVVVLTHDPKIDDPALRSALQSEAFYIGALGSRRTHAKRLERLLAAGFTQQQTARIHAPVGLDIGARTPAEIAVAIIAEVTAVLRGRSPFRATDSTTGSQNLSTGSSH
jgi:xanthine dehydrogenase accessory factor